jgi:membrane-associated phospholipid phosphatase
MPFLAWPGWAHLRYAGGLSLANAVWFAVVYGGCDAVTAQRSLRLPVHVPAELRIPLVPAMTVFYMSLYGMFLLAPFILRNREEFRAVVITMALVTACGGVGFLVYPAQLAFPPARESQLGTWSGLYHFADALNLDYNLVPSLHVAFAVVCASVFALRAPTAGKVAFWMWAVLIATSTVLIHQHHLVDVAAGWMVAVVGVRTVYRRPYGQGRDPSARCGDIAGGRLGCPAGQPGRQATRRRRDAGRARQDPRRRQR